MAEAPAAEGGPHLGSRGAEPEQAAQQPYARADAQPPPPRPQAALVLHLAPWQPRYRHPLNRASRGGAQNPHTPAVLLDCQKQITGVAPVLVPPAADHWCRASRRWAVQCNVGQCAGGGRTGTNNAIAAERQAQKKRLQSVTKRQQSHWPGSGPFHHRGGKNSNPCSPGSGGGQGVP